MVRRIANRASAAVSKLFIDWAGGERRPVTFDVERDYPALLEIRNVWQEIRAEAIALLQQVSGLPRYHDLDALQEMISAEQNGANWRVLMLYCYGERFEKNIARCPATMRAIARVPGVAQAFLSVLEPGKSVPAHEGPLSGVLRYHLGLVTPKIDPPSIRVHDQVHIWDEGHDFMFDDSWNHEVSNISKEIRVILIVDVMRPMPWHLKAINWIYLFVLGRMFYARGVLKS
jgi:aspartyl/asparaginyl beta-hydroxylase (cupin superfamily)